MRAGAVTFWESNRRERDRICRDRAVNASGANIIVDVLLGTSSQALFPLEIVIRGGIALVGGVPGIGLVNAGKREIV